MTIDIGFINMFYVSKQEYVEAFYFASPPPQSHWASYAGYFLLAQA
jgi:hypothetical protein